MRENSKILEVCIASVQDAREAVALRMGRSRGCDYRVAAHTAEARMMHVTAEHTIVFGKGKADDPRLNAPLDLAATVVAKRGSVSASELQVARVAGLFDAEILDTLAVVVLTGSRITSMLPCRQRSVVRPRRRSSGLRRRR